MDSRTACNFLCLLLCSAGVVVYGQDSCATLGNITEIYHTCIGQHVDFATYKRLNLTSKLGHVCGSKQKIRQCLINMTLNCSLPDVITMLKQWRNGLLCNDTSVSQWAIDNLNVDRQQVTCRPDFSQPPDCRTDVDKLLPLFPFQNETLSDGIASLALIKRTYFSCLKTWLQESNCTETGWRYTYKVLVISVFEDTHYFGFSFDDWDKQVFDDLQAGLEQVQTPLSVRDIFGIFS